MSVRLRGWQRRYGGAPEVPDPDSRLPFQERLLARLEASPIVVSAALSDVLPPIHAGAWTVEVEGQTYATSEDCPRVRRGLITPDFFGVSARGGTPETRRG